MKMLDWQRPTFVITAFCFSLAAGLSDRSALAQFKSPEGQGTPAGTVGGGSRPVRPFCQQSNSQEVPLAMAPTQVIGLTSQVNPTLWVYVPNANAKTLEFSLLTQEQGEVYQTNFPIATAGLIKITFPKTLALIPGRPYQWKAAFVCDPKDRLKDAIVGGSIQQQLLPVALQQQLKAATPEQRIKLYLRSGFWYEALNSYLELKQTQPQNRNLTPIGMELLQVAGLSAIAPPEQLLRVAEPAPTSQAIR